MDESAAIELARRALALAGAAGARSAEASVSIARRFHSEALDRVVARLEGSTVKSLFLRVFCDGRKSALSTSDLTDEGLHEAVERAVANARHVTPDPLAGLPEEVGADGAELDLADESISQRDDAEKVEEALLLERLIRAADPRISNSSGSHYTDAVAVTALANSSGFAAAYRWTRAGRSTGPIALDGAVKRIAQYGTAARYLSALESLEAVAMTAARRAVDLFGARKPPTIRVPVIFERDVAASLLDDIFAAVSAGNVAVGNSWLSGHVGSRIGTDLVNIVDDGRMPGGLAPRPSTARASRRVGRPCSSGGR